MSNKKRTKKAIKYEKAKAKVHRGEHLGGPGKPDYQRGRKKGEVKDWSRPVHSGIINKAIEKGVKEIEAKSGYTAPAIKIAKKHRIKLFKRGKKVEEIR